MMKILAAAVIAAVVAFSAHAQAPREFVAGQHYQELPTQVRVADPERQEVVEVFSYMCIHCFHFTPTIEEWASDVPDDVNFVRLPAVFDQSLQYLARAYYTAEVLGVVDAVHRPIFEAIHVSRSNILDEQRLARLFEEHAQISPAEFQRVFGSAGVDTRARQADAQGRAYRISGTPTMIVNGKYRTDGQMAGSNPAMLDVVDHLLELERANAANRHADD